MVPLVVLSAEFSRLLMSLFIDSVRSRCKQTNILIQKLRAFSMPDDFQFLVFLWFVVLQQVSYHSTLAPGYSYLHSRFLLSNFIVLFILFHDIPPNVFNLTLFWVVCYLNFFLAKFALQVFPMSSEYQILKVKL